MKLIKPSFEILPQQSGEVGMLKHIETCGRVAWKSEDKTTDDSYIKFIDMLKGVNHGSVLEHGTVYLSYRIDYNSNSSSKGYSQELEWKIENFISKYTNNKYSKVIRYKIHYANFIAITTNYRVLVENNWLDDLKYQCEPTEYHEKRVTVRFVMDRIGSQSFVRHRVFSFTQESTRYCNYSKDKFGNELTFIQPVWFTEEDLDEITKIEAPNRVKAFTCKGAVQKYLLGLHCAEQSYFGLIEEGWKPQQARAVLPNSLKTELIMTGFVSDWKHFFMLRTAKGAHPQAQELAIPLQEEFKRLKLI